MQRTCFSVLCIFYKRMLYLFLHFLFDCSKQLLIRLIRRNLRIVGFDFIGRAEQEACLAWNHAEIIIGIAACDRFESDRLQCFDRGELRLLDSHLKAGDLSVVCDFQGVAEQGRIAEFFHQRCGKLREGVADQDHLGEGAQLVEELSCARQWIDLLNRSLNLFQSQAVLF